MDEIFDEVDFSYTIKSSDKVCQVETLEDLEYGAPPIIEAEGLAKVDPQDQDGKDFSTDQASELQGGQKIIRDNQTGIS